MKVFTILVVVLVSSLAAGAAFQPQIAKKNPSEIHSNQSADDVQKLRDLSFVHFVGGEFLMGSPINAKSSAEFRRIEKPQHTRLVDEFWLAKYLVSAQEFCAFMNECGLPEYVGRSARQFDDATIRNNKGKYSPQPYADRCPAYPVTWIGATKYCEWMSLRTGVTLRLPTEAEWEFAARGNQLRKWPWGSKKPAIEYRKGKPGNWRPFYEVNGYRWMFVPWDGSQPWMKAPVGSFPRGDTPEGVCDMLGYYPGQWCEDVLSSYEQQENNDLPIVEREQRVLRGASQIQVDMVTYKPPPAPVRVLLGDGGVEFNTDGRSWSRIGGNETKDGGLIRMATSKLPRIPSGHLDHRP